MVPPFDLRIQRSVESPAFIASPDGRYGTRCSTVVVGERDLDKWRITITERSFDKGGVVVNDRRAVLDGWPRRDTRPRIADTTAA